MVVGATKTPQFLGPDGVLRERYTFTTDVSTRFFTGVMSADTVDMQVSVRGSAFTSDPDLIVFEGTSFTIPNPSAFPDGLRLFPGDNVIEVRSVLSSGETTAAGVAEARLSLDRDVRAGVLAPTGIFVERSDRTVTISVEGIDDPNVSGYHFYASTAPGGGSLGYNRINPNLVISAELEEDTEAIAELNVDANIATKPDGTPAADPLFLKVRGDQVNQGGTVLQADFNQALEIAENIEQIRTTVLVESVRRRQVFSFVHDRQASSTTTENPAIPNADFNAIPETDPLYYVVSAVYVIDGREIESAFSPEVAASPIIVTPAISSLPTVSRQQIVQDTVLAIFRSHPEVDVKPGSVLRDTFIDPFSTEAERIRFIVGFLQAAQSFATLLVIDDPGFTGESINVSQSPYKLALKQAFFLRTNADVQNLIDNAFDQLAARRGVIRKTGNRARGEVTFYVNERPATDRFMAIGTIVEGGSVQFRATSASEITASGAGAVFNPVTGRYSVSAFIQADTAGSAGNLAAGQIRAVRQGPTGVNVVNEAATFGGEDQESNRSLAVRADGVLSSVDSGTYRGYVQNTIDIPGVAQVSVVDSGHSLMMRDLDPEKGVHTGGKVDVWIRGENLAEVTDSFAFSFEIVRQGQFEPIGSLSNLRFRAVNSAISDANPIIEMLEYPTWGFEFVNETTGKAFDLTDYQIIPPDGIQLSSAHNDPLDSSLTDEFRGSYRFRMSDKYVFPRQPVRQIISLEGEVSGILDSTIYSLFPGSLPLDMGRSTEAGDYLQVIEPLVSATGEVTTIPSGEPISVTGEEHVMLEGIEYLNSLGVNPLTVQVFNEDRTIEYYGPFAPGVDADYTFIDESGQQPLGILLTADSRISEGQTVLTDYEHDENFVVEYEINSLVSVVQGDLDQTRHVTADVLAKEAIPVGVDISATIVMHRNQVKSTVDSNVRTDLSRLFGSLVLGEPVRQGDIIDTIESVSGVSYVVVPLTQMVKTDDSLVTREAVATDQPIDYFEITDWGSDLISVYLLLNPLESGTAHGGGAPNKPRGVFRDDIALTLYDIVPDINGVPIKNAPNAAFIIGNPGLTIPGYSDNDTLKQEYPFATDAEIDQKRQEITQRRVLVALPSSETPSDGTYTVTYVVSDDEGTKNIDVGPIEYLELGDLDFSYDQDAGRSNL